MAAAVAMPLQVAPGCPLNSNIYGPRTLFFPVEGRRGAKRALSSPNGASTRALQREERRDVSYILFPARSPLAWRVLCNVSQLEQIAGG